MLTPVANNPTCASAWLAAVDSIDAVHGTYNAVVDVANPTVHTPADVAAIMAVDSFLRARNAYPIATVANTIFPQDLYRRFGAIGLRDEYLTVYDSIRKKGWGRYFERMVRWPGRAGKAPTDQLQQLVERLRKQLNARQTFRNVYEMTLYDPEADRNRNRNRQCLSFLSFKYDPDHGLMLTAMYRNHHYISRALGNFIGLGHLMSYIAKEAGGIKVGSLTCVSTHAEIDTASKCWNKADARGLIAAAKSAFAAAQLDKSASKAAG